MDGSSNLLIEFHVNIYGNCHDAIEFISCDMYGYLEMGYDIQYPGS